MDRTGKMSGRGAYLCPESECLTKAKKNRSLERALNIKIPDEVYDRLTEEKSLMICNDDRVLPCWALHKKPGRFFSGDATVEAKISKRGALVIVASDAPENTKKKK